MAHFDLIDWNAVALGVVELTRTPVYAEHRLKKGTGTRSAQGKRAPDAECKRRREIRELNEKLSRYYQLGVGRSEWRCPKLLSKGKHGVIASTHDIPLTCALF